jgi:homocitrate synthase NifV
MKIKKYIVDTTLRDGEQSPFVYLTEGKKVLVAGLLCRLGIHQIEAGISALGIPEQRIIGKIIENKGNTLISVWSRLHPEDVRKAIACEPDLVHVTIPASYLHIYTKLGKNKQWIINRLDEVLEIMSQSHCRLSVGFEDASRADIAFLMRLLSILEPFGTSQIRLADTVGASSPATIRELVRTIRSFTQIPIEIHAHNDLGIAIAVTTEALKAGAQYADTTLLGVGERSGNCGLKGLLDVVHPIFDMGIDCDAARETEDEFSRIIGFELKSQCGSLRR